MTTSDKRIAILCGRCGSTDVSRDALTEWSVELQDWVLRGVLDNATCETCGTESHLVEAVLDDVAVP
jgi:ribosomal protein S27AE